MAHEPLARCREFAAACAPLRLLAAAIVSPPRSAPVAAPKFKCLRRRMNASLTYDARRENQLAEMARAIGDIGHLSFCPGLCCSLSWAVRSRGMRSTPAIFDNSSDALGALIPADRSEGATANYDAAPQDTGNGQVLTVVAGPQQTLKDLSLRYAGHFDSDLSKKILQSQSRPERSRSSGSRAAHPNPLAPGAMKKVNDTAEAATSSDQKPQEISSPDSPRSCGNENKSRGNRRLKNGHRNPRL